MLGVMMPLEIFRMKMKRGEVWIVSFSAAKANKGGEIQKTRPAVIVSNDIANEHLNQLQVLPLTSNTEKCYPCEAYVKIEGKTNKAMADQIVTISKERLKKKIGHVSSANMLDIERALRIQLDL